MKSGGKKITNTYNQIVQLNLRMASDIYSLKCAAVISLLSIKNARFTIAVSSQFMATW